jgi:hypothetical protein
MDIDDLMRGKPDTFRFHLAHPGIGAHQYMRAKRIALGRQLLKKRRVYPDTMYWVWPRGVEFGKGIPNQREIFDRLQDLCVAGKVICPESYPIFAELLHQTDPKTPAATAKAIDIFGEGLCIQPPDELLKMEVLAFVRRPIGPNAPD